MKRRILLVDDEVAVLLTLKAVLEISGFEVNTAASAREGKHLLHTHEFDMVITDMRMESDAAGAEVVEAARLASYRPAVALLTAFPLAEEDWQSMGADKMLVKPMHTRVLLQQIEKLFESHEARQRAASTAAAKPAVRKKTPVRAKAPAKKKVSVMPVARKAAAKKAVRPGAKRVLRKSAAKKTGAKSMKKK